MDQEETDSHSASSRDANIDAGQCQGCKTYVAETLVDELCSKCRVFGCSKIETMNEDNEN